MSMLLVALWTGFAFFGCGDIGLFHCEDGCLVVPIDPSHIPSDDPRHEGWVIQDTDEDLNRFQHGVPSDQGPAAWAQTLQPSCVWLNQTLGLPAQTSCWHPVMSCRLIAIHDRSCQKSQLQIYRVWHRIRCLLSALVCSLW